MRHKSAFNLFYLVVILFGCGEDDPQTQHEYQINLGAHADDVLYTNLPVHVSFFPLLSSNSNENIEWSFGDGTTSTSFEAENIYSKPGTYVISLKSNNKIVDDTTIVVTPKPPVVVSPDVYEEVKFLYQNQNSDYILLCRDSETGDYFHGVVSKDFEMKEFKRLDFLDHWEFECVGISKNGLLFPSPPHATEIDNSGAQVKLNLISPGSSFTPKDIIQTEAGYRIAGEGSGQVIICDLDLDLQLQTLKSIKTFEFSEIPNVYFEGPDIVRIHHLKAASGFFDMISQNLEGDVLHQKTYPGDIAKGSFKFQEGYLLFGPGYDYQASYNFSVTNTNGDIITTIPVAASKNDIGSLTNGPLRIGFVERSDFIYIFFGTMQVLKIGKTGVKVWQKTFSTWADRFSAVIVNEKGNFVMVGEHHYDPEMQQFTEHDGKRDLIFIEIDENGNYLNAK